MWLVLLACAVQLESTPQAGPYFDDPPTITALTWACDEEAGTWNVAVDTLHWTGGGYFYLALDGASIERHPLTSEEAAADGSWDHLEITLKQVADFRDVQLGTSSRYLCSEKEALSYLLSVKTADAAERADCRTWGVDPTIYDVEGIGICETVLAEETPGDEDTGT